MTSLQYIKNQTRCFQTFVANRVAEIHETTSPKQRHHVPGSMNQLMTVHGASLFSISNPDVGGGQVLVFYGSLNISGPLLKWKTFEVMINKIRRPAAIILTTDTSQADLLLQRYSSWSRLPRVMSWVLRLVKPLKKKKPKCVVGSTLTIVELQRANEVITRFVQRQHFREEYMALKEADK